MRIVAVGSVAFDTIHTPVTSHERLLGGSASYFSLAAIHLSPVGIVAVVGADFTTEQRDLLSLRGVDLAGLETAAGPTFHWEGAYAEDPNVRTTLRTELGVFEAFHPALPPSYSDADVLFLANIDPILQLEVLDRVRRAPVVAVDTMNFWIEGNLEAVHRVVARADILFLNDEEARMLTGHPNLVRAAGEIRMMGPEVVVIKTGVHGAAALGPWGWILFPAYPVANVVDPTGAGDSFAGGLMGYLAGKNWRDRDRFAEALAVGTCVASLTVESFGVAALSRDRTRDLRERYDLLQQAMRFGPPQGF